MVKIVFYLELLKEIGFSVPFISLFILLLCLITTTAPVMADITVTATRYQISKFPWLARGLPVKSKKYVIKNVPTG